MSSYLYCKENVLKMTFAKDQIFTISTIRNKNEAAADFETAISASGYGKFNYLLYLLCIPVGWSFMFATTTMSYVFPAAQCDLDLSLEDKGFLNAITYLGGVCSGAIWGFLFDVYGRKKLLVFCFLCDGLAVIVSSIAYTKTLLVVTKFIGGFMFNGPFSAFTSYLCEFQCAKHRARSQLYLGLTINVGGLVLPLLAWATISQNLNLTLFNIELHSWNICLFLCSLPSIVSGIMCIFMPESPKFLMSMGKNEQALDVFRQVYAMNTGRPGDTYPIAQLVEEVETKTENRSKLKAFGEGWQQMKPLFLPPHLLNFILVVVMQTLAVMSQNSLRLWFPQIFQAINDYEMFHNTSSSVCQALDSIQPNNATYDCSFNHNNSFVYINTIIISSTTVAGFVFVVCLVNVIGKNRLLGIVACICGTAAISIYFTNNSMSFLATTAIFATAGSITTNVLVTITVDLFPTTLRTMTISLAMLSGRIGAIVGNLIFPYLLRIGCGPPFFLPGLQIIVCAVLVIFLPNTDLKALE